MKPSAQIERIRKRLSKEAYDKQHGNPYGMSKSYWDADKVKQDSFLLPAIVEYLDNVPNLGTPIKHKPSNNGRKKKRSQTNGC